MPTSDVAQRALRVLVVDDDPVIRMLVAEALAAIGIETQEAESGEQALAAIRNDLPDLVLLDVDMPGMDGFETCSAIRAGPVGNEIPVMIATGLTDAQTMERAFDVGASDFIKKPIDWQVFQHRVRFLMRAYGAFADLKQAVCELELSKKRLANAQRLSKLGDWEWQPEADEMLWSAAVFEILEIEPGPGASSYAAFMGAIHSEDRAGVEKAVRVSVCEHKPWVLEHRIVTRGGEERIVRQQAEVTSGPDGAVQTVTGTIQDVTEQRENEERIHFLAYYDRLTALPNREMLEKHLHRVLHRANQSSKTVALLCLDIDRFERVNDTLGREMGDEFLRAFALRLEECVRTTDFVAYIQGEIEPVSRLGGDEFTVVLDHVRSEADAAVAARRILDCIAEPFTVAGHSLVMSASIGIAVFPRDGSDVETLLRSADTAMHHAKKRDQGSSHFFDAALNERAARNLALENALRVAIEAEELTLHYQPKFQSSTGEMIGAEALARWHSAELGDISPGEFIPVAEDVGLIGKLGEWALRQTCRQISAWRDDGFDPVSIAVNVSSLQVRSGNLVATVRRLLEEYAVDPGLMEIEITESALLDGSDAVVAELTGLKNLGLTVALDDFGTGYSSLSYLTRFPIDVIKLDGSFVSGIIGDAAASPIVAAVIGLAHRLEMKVVAEGVETELQAGYLRLEGCDALQGFLYSRPVCPDEITSLMSRSGDR
jgi:diguanylate cyclase (GGDEF)-like protein